ncbi:RTA1 like protein-domain-containing protein [Cladorrhinum sp. PSN259]|nr:RTA1 like protein-domain-containing protein [Cladorrhinum sp. PSN259]
MNSTDSGGVTPAPSSDDLWNTLLGIRTGCYPFMPDILKPVYGYRPTLGAGITFDVLFALVMIGHFLMLALYRKWTSFLFAVGSLTELLGWVGRTWSATCPYNQNAFLMQITTLILAPTFYSAALYVLLAILINSLGRQTSLLSPKLYALIFCTCDVLSLIIQAIGGGMAAQATNRKGGDTAPGTHTMVAGIVFQLFTMTIFAGLVCDFLRRVFVLQQRQQQGQSTSTGNINEEGRERKNGLLLTKRMKLVLGSMFVAFIMIYVRSIYRTIELAEGWSGHLITHEGYFIALDAALMFVAAAVWLMMDPAVLLRDGEQQGTTEVKAGESGTGAARDQQQQQDHGEESESSWGLERKSAEGI